MTPTDRLSLACVFAIVLVMVACGYAVAEPLATGAGSTGLDPSVELLVMIVSLAGVLLSPIAAAVGIWAAKWFKAKTGLDLTEDADRVARQAVGLAEQLAEKRLATSKLQMPGPEKLQVALKHFLDVAIEKGWPAWVRGKAEAYIESQLGNRLKGTLLDTNEKGDVNVNIRKVEVVADDPDRVVIR